MNNNSAFLNNLRANTLSANSGPLYNPAANPTVLPATSVSRGGSQATSAQPSAPTKSTKTTGRNLGIDTFVSFLRTAMNPLRGMTGSTPLDLVANTVSNALYSSVNNTAEDKATKNTLDFSQVTPQETPTATIDETPSTSVDNDTIEYTYKPGDTFGQVVKDLGLMTDAGLWGSGGDVEYYTQQLIEQGALDNRGNIPVGTTIRLRRRGAPSNPALNARIV